MSRHEAARVRPATCRPVGLLGRPVAAVPRERSRPRTPRPTSLHPRCSRSPKPAAPSSRQTSSRAAHAGIAFLIAFIIGLLSFGLVRVCRALRPLTLINKGRSGSLPPQAPKTRRPLSGEGCHDLRHGSGGDRRRLLRGNGTPRRLLPGRSVTGPRRPREIVWQDSGRFSVDRVERPRVGRVATATAPPPRITAAKIQQSGFRGGRTESEVGMKATGQPKE